uniref:Cation/H+ exchanger transmembrane domain-containing protein n=1 Tax=Compsopogon caeruleus TaxID=31354 RepID=A0A7S1THT6_9RHOD
MAVVQAFSLVMLLLTGTVTIRCINLHFMRLSPSSMMALSALLTSVALMMLDNLNVLSLGGAVELVRRGLLDLFPEMLMDCMLGFLLFAAAIEVDLMALMRVRSTVFSLAVVGTTSATIIIGLLTWFLVRPIYPLPLPICLLFGAALSPTDPVAVTSVLNEKPDLIPASTRYFVWCESLFNDAVAVVLFYAFKNISSSSDNSIPNQVLAFSWIFLREVIIGIMIGLLLAYFAHHLIASVDDAVLEVTITIVLVGNIQVICAYFDASVPLASAVAGLLIGNYGVGYAMSPEARDGFHVLWKFIDETLNSILTLLIGLMTVFWEADALSLRSMLYLSLGIIPISLLARAASIGLGLGFIFAGEWILGRRLRHPHVRYRGGTVAVLTWGGLRGAITIALALAIVRHLNTLGTGLVTGQIIFAMTYSVVVFSIVCQGLFFEQACVLIQDASFRYLKHGGLGTFKSTHSLALDRDHGDPDDVPDLEDLVTAMESLSRADWTRPLASSDAELNMPEERNEFLNHDSELAPSSKSSSATRSRRREVVHIRDESVTFHNLDKLKPIPPIGDMFSSAFNWARPRYNEELPLLQRHSAEDVQK